MAKIMLFSSSVALYLAYFCLIVTAKDTYQVTIDSTKPFSTVDPRFISVTQDASVINHHWENFNFTSAVGLACLQALRPAYLRFGGTQADFLNYSFSSEQIGMSNHSMVTMTARDFDLLYGYFVQQGGLDLVFGLNDLNSRNNQTLAWDPTGAEALLDYFASKNYTITALELDNEPDLDHEKNGNITAEQLSHDFDMLQSVLQQRKLAIPVFGPDLANSPSYLSEFTKSQAISIERKVAAVTVHHYYGNSAKFQLADFLNIKTLDSLQDKLQELQDAKSSLGNSPMYLGETSSTYGGM
eukprot:m.179193 g.179193  ORF g.179193 m.179193 type:complete len:298 (-) comp16845_c0_seq7:43-936(-)